MRVIRRSKNKAVRLHKAHSDSKKFIVIDTCNLPNGLEMEFNKCSNACKLSSYGALECKATYANLFKFLLIR